MICNPLDDLFNLARIVTIYMKNLKQRLEMTVVTYVTITQAFQGIV